MSRHQPATIQSQIKERFLSILRTEGRIRQQNDLETAELLHECETLASVDAATASILRAEIYQLIGKIDQVEYWVKNAKSLGRKIEAESLLVIAYANLGYVGKAAERFAEIVKVDRGVVNEHLPLGLACGSFSAIVDASAALQRAGGEVRCQEYVMTAQMIIDTLKNMQVSESVIRSMMDEAGKVMRSHSVMWLNDAPDFTCSSQSDSPFVDLKYHVNLGPHEAAEMTWTLAEALISKDLMLPNVTISFMGTPSREGSWLNDCLRKRPTASGKEFRDIER